MRLSLPVHSISCNFIPLSLLFRLLQEPPDPGLHCLQSQFYPGLGYKKSMLNSAEHKIFLAHKRQNGNNCCHFDIYEQENSILGSTEPEKAEYIYIFLYL